MNTPPKNKVYVVAGWNYYEGQLVTVVDATDSLGYKDVANLLPILSKQGVVLEASTDGYIQVLIDDEHYNLQYHNIEPVDKT